MLSLNKSDSCSQLSLRYHYLFDDENNPDIEKRIHYLTLSNNDNVQLVFSVLYLKPQNKSFMSAITQLLFLLKKKK